MIVFECLLNLWRHVSNVGPYAYIKRAEIQKFDANSFTVAYDTLLRRIRIRNTHRKEIERKRWRERENNEIWQTHIYFTIILFLLLCIRQRLLQFRSRSVSECVCVCLQTRILYSREDDFWFWNSTFISQPLLKTVHFELRAKERERERERTRDEKREWKRDI